MLAQGPEISIVVPTLNEERTIAEFVEWCKEGLRKSGSSGQILIVDSSDDKTPDIAQEHGAEVLSVPKRGLGQAYQDAIPHIRGRYILLGDADLTYDFREIGTFLEKLREGYEFVIGSRVKGKIGEGAMPFLHQFFGIPVTTWLLNWLYKSHFSDIHCGMRGITYDALSRMNLTSRSWEYASEMVLKAVHLNLRITEIPICFYKDRVGRVSHHKRLGFWSPWYAGYLNLKVMLAHKFWK